LFLFCKKLFINTQQNYFTPLNKNCNILQITYKNCLKIGQIKKITRTKPLLKIKKGSIINYSLIIFFIYYYMKINTKDHLIFDIAVIGGGASGMMAAIWAAESGAKVALIEKNQKLGKKLLITGKGRCNVTQENFTKDTLVENIGKNGKFLFSAFAKFSVEDTKKFFQEEGVELKTERGGRIFPASDSAEEIVGALRSRLAKNKVIVIRNNKIAAIQIKDNLIFGLSTKKGTIVAKQFILCTGGKSYSGTGSTGDGYTWSEELGHSVIEPMPALTPMKTRDKWIEMVTGLTLKNVALRAMQKGKKEDERFGDMLFTHFGVSGPIVLDMSKKVGQMLKNGEVQLSIDLKPALDFDALDKRLQRDFQKYQNKQFKNALEDLFPQRLIPVMISLSKISPEKKINKVSKEERQNLVKLTKNLLLNVTELGGFNHAIITAGGINLKEVNSQTMQSRKIENLYFGGEVLDLDGPTGGYNLQISWSTGYLAGTSAAKALGLEKENKEEKEEA
jgi:predicted Rossmann fold flavoprotein